MLSYCTVANLNNNAIAFFQQGRYEDAVSNLKVSINQIVANIENRPACPPCLRSSLATPSEMPFFSQVMFRVPIERPTPCRESHTASSMYSCVMALSENYQDFSSEHYVTRASAAILYNFAFLHHWRAIHLGVSSGMTKALQLYSMALKVVSPKKGDHPDLENLALAIWNNMGHIHSLLFQLDEARVCFDRLRMLLAHRSDLRYWIPVQDYENFLLSAMFQGSELHLAPAA